MKLETNCPLTPSPLESRFRYHLRICRLLLTSTFLTQQHRQPYYWSLPTYPFLCSASALMSRLHTNPTPYNTSGAALCNVTLLEQHFWSNTCDAALLEQHFRSNTCNCLFLYRSRQTFRKIHANIEIATSTQRNLCAGRPLSAIPSTHTRVLALVAVLANWSRIARH